MSQLQRLARPFPKSLIHENPSGGGSYVKHSVVTEKLLAVVGPFSFELVEIVRGHVDGIEPNPQGKSARAKRGAPALESCIVGAVCRLRVVVDSVPVSIEEVGDCEQPHNWPHDGARLKDAMSDALKRAAMRVGVTLHLWSGSEFSLYDQLCASESAGAERAVSDTRAFAAPTGERGVSLPAPSRVPEPAPAPSAAVSGTQPARETDTAASPSEWRPPASEMFAAVALRKSLYARGISIHDVRKREGLPKLEDVEDDSTFRLWQRVLADLDTANPIAS